jgi:hypothetical protein
LAVALPPWVRWWLFGAIVGIVLLSVVVFSTLVFPLALAALVLLAVRSPERAAFGGGALIPTGLWFLYGLRAAVQRCAEIDRSPSGSCSIFGVNEQAIAMSLYVAVGLGLTAYAASRRRRPRVSADPSAGVPTRR